MKPWDSDSMWDSKSEEQIKAERYQRVKDQLLKGHFVQLNFSMRVINKCKTKSRCAHIRLICVWLNSNRGCWMTPGCRRSQKCHLYVNDLTLTLGLIFQVLWSYYSVCFQRMTMKFNHYQQQMFQVFQHEWNNIQSRASFKVHFTWMAEK